MRYVTRTKDEEIRAFIEDPRPHKPVLLVEGARQVGKTCLVMHALAQIKRRSLCLNLERDTLFRAEVDACSEFREFEGLLGDRYGFDAGSDTILFFDEAQESKRLGGFVRFMKEDWERATVILSGSTLRRLFRSDTRYPVGRVQRLMVTPFSFTEFLSAAGKRQMLEAVRARPEDISLNRHQRLLELYDRFLETGGLPEVVMAGLRDEDHEKVRAQIIADYQADFIRLFGEEAIHIVDACFRSVANFVGNVSKNTSVIPNPGTHVNAKINEVFSRLESWHLILRSDQRGPSPEGGHKYLPKRYLFDTGILRHVRESAVPAISVLTSAHAAVRTILGGVIENQTAIDLARHCDELTGWKKAPSGGEIDFILRLSEGSAVPVECKASLTVNRRHMRGVLDYLRLLSLRTGVVVSLAPHAVTPFEDGRRIINIPAYLVERLPDLVSG